jgi:hypothetical protein
MNSYRDSGEQRERNAEFQRMEPAEMDAELEQVVKDFRSSVHAWSEAELSHPRALTSAVRRRSWRLAAGWALGCALIAGGVSGAVYERHHQQELAKAAALREAEHQRQLAAEKTRNAEEELAKVDKEVARDAPAAMESLAQLMGEDDSQ